VAFYGAIGNSTVFFCKYLSQKSATTLRNNIFGPEPQKDAAANNTQFIGTVPAA
jgi:hypothetical protein